jgi:hypothetical protein
MASGSQNFFKQGVWFAPLPSDTDNVGFSSPRNSSDVLAK